MEIFKNIKDVITPTCIKENIERKSKLDIKENEIDRERMIKKPKVELEQNISQPNMPSYSSLAPYPEIVDAIPNDRM